MTYRTLIRICFILSRLACLLLGILILLTVAPHRNLWLMEHVQSKLPDKGTAIPKWVPGKSGMALSFDGNSHVEVPHDSSLDLTERGHTISYWLKWDGVGGYSPFISKTNAGDDSNYHTWVGSDSVWDYCGNNNQQVHGKTPIPLNGDWNLFLTVTHDGKKTVSFYLNGVFDNAETLPEAPPNDAPFRVGNDGMSTNGGGALDELTVFNRALNQGEIRALMEEGAKPLGEAIADKSLVLHFSFDERKGSVVKDLSQHKNNGTIKGEQFQVALFHWSAQFSLTTLIFVICLILACLISFSKDARNALMEFAQRRRWFLIGMILFFWLLFTKIAIAFLTLLSGLLLIRLFSVKKKSSLFLADAQTFLLRLSVLSIFLFTLKPTPSGWPIVLYLIFGSLGILFVLIGTYPFLRFLGKRYSGLRDSFITVGQRLCQFFYSVKPAFFLLFFFLFVFILTNLGSYFLFEHIPHVTDSIKQVFHGKIFATGRLVGQSHPLKEFFDFRCMTNDMWEGGKWYSEYPPGHSFLMMWGAFIKAPWLINPLLGTLTVLLLYFLGKEFYDERTGRLAALLGALSPFLLVMSSEFMNHVSTLFYATLFLLFFAKTVRGGKWYAPLLAGVGLGMMINVRSYTAVAIAAPFGIYSLLLLIRDFRAYLWRIVALLIVTLCFFGILLGYNYLTNGSPTLFGYVIQFGKGHNPGFGHSAWDEPPHTPQMGLIQNLNNLNALNKCLFEWPIPSLLFVLILFLSSTRNKWDYLLIISVFALSFAYFFYWYQDLVLGPRFMYESSSMLILLTARGLLRIPDFVQKVLKVLATKRLVKAVAALSLLLCLTITLFYHVPSLVRYYSNDFYSSFNADVLKAVKKAKITNAIVFVRTSFFGGVLPANSPLLDGDVIYARDLGERNRLLIEYYPNREYYRAEGATIWKLPMAPQ